MFGYKEMPHLSDIKDETGDKKTEDKVLIIDEHSGMQPVVVYVWEIAETVAPITNDAPEGYEDLHIRLEEEWRKNSHLSHDYARALGLLMKWLDTDHYEEEED